MKALLIPIKDPTNAKMRLAEVLSAGDRRRLAWAMFEDVSRAVMASRKPDRVVMVTSFAPAIERAGRLGWDVLLEESQISESASVDWASRVLSDRGFDTVIRLPADLPLVRAEDIDELLSIEIGSPGALLVPSFMGRSPLAAMHGYDPAHPDMTGLLASNRPLPADVTHLAHLRAFFEHELDEASRPGHTLGAAS